MPDICPRGGLCRHGSCFFLPPSGDPGEILECRDGELIPRFPVGGVHPLQRASLSALEPPSLSARPRASRSARTRRLPEYRPK